MKILLVEDEQRIADVVVAGLEARGCRVTHRTDGELGLESAMGASFDAIVLDIMLPGRDGLAVLQAIRAAGDPTPVLLLTARNELGDRVRGLELGADDYLAKPFFVEELVARLQALVRRTAGERQNALEVDGLVLDRIGRQLMRGARRAELTSREYALLEYLMRSAGQAFTRRQILEHVWGYDFDPSTNVVDVCVRRIREKIASVAISEQDGSPIESIRGSGYRFRRAAESS